MFRSTSTNIPSCVLNASKMSVASIVLRPCIRARSMARLNRSVVSGPMRNPFPTCDCRLPVRRFSIAILTTTRSTSTAAPPLWATRSAPRDVDLVVGDAEVAHRDHRDAGEGFVDFVKIDLAGVPAGLGQRLGHRADRGGGELGGLVGVGGVAHHPGDGREAEPRGGALAGRRA